MCNAAIQRGGASPTTHRLRLDNLPVANRPVQLVFLFADVGGGHRAPAEAVREALCRTVGDGAQVTLVDALADYAPYPLNRAPQTYTQAARFSRLLLGWFYHALDSPTRVRPAAGVIRQPMGRALRKMRADYPADLYVSFHPTYSFPLTQQRIPSVFLFTDLVTNHALWCAPGAERYLVPSEVARERAIRRGVPADQIEITGLPVHPHFTDPLDPPHVLRSRLGVVDDRPIILLSGGGEGMGRVYDIACAIGESGVAAQMVVIAGRNDELRERLESAAWPMPTRVLGFTHNMPEWMAVADVLISKAGSNTIAEALTCGLPIILFEHVPGQEEGNPELLMRGGAGAYCPRPGQVVSTLQDWFADRRRLAQLAANARVLARPNAAFDAGRIIYQIAEARAHPLSA